ncbi:MAG: hypothetical protein FWC41_08515 [Firmicutes bacterium]|nr:hypothetical protein [Bacillota bacterium]
MYNVSITYKDGSKGSGKFQHKDSITSLLKNELDNIAEINIKEESPKINIKYHNGEAG